MKTKEREQFEADRVTTLSCIYVFGMCTTEVSRQDTQIGKNREENTKTKTEKNGEETSGARAGS